MGLINRDEPIATLTELGTLAFDAGKTLELLIVGGGAGFYDVLRCTETMTEAKVAIDTFNTWLIFPNR